MGLIALRFVEYAAGSILFGAPLFLLYMGAAAPKPLPRMVNLATLVSGAAGVLVLAAPLHFLVQTSEIAPGAALDADTLKAAFLEMNYGKAGLVRGVAALLALAATIMLGGARRWQADAVLGAVACASFAWMGHGAAGEGGLAWIHLGNDMVHILAAAGWIGALAVFALWLRREMPVAALRDFSGFGIAFAGTLVVTGVGNGFFMLGAPSQLWRSLYGLVLMAKLVLFLGMLGLAARNRMAVRTGGDGVQRALWVETGLGFVVLAVVAWLGMLEPPR